MKRKPSLEKNSVDQKIRKVTANDDGYESDSEDENPPSDAENSSKLPKILKSDPKKCTLFIAGTGEMGQLGFGPDITEKKLIAGMSLFKEVEIIDCAASYLFNAVILKRNDKHEVFTWGCNDEAGGHVLGRYGEESEPQVIPELVDADICKVSIGQYHMAALDLYGRLYFWGNFKCDDFMGALYNVPKETIMVPKVYPDLKDERFITIASASNFIVAVTTDHRIIEWGWTDRSTEEHSTKRETLIPHDNSLPFTWRVDAISAGHVHALALATNIQNQKKVFSWGFNQQGQLGLGHLLALEKPTAIQTLPPNVVQIAAGEFHNLVLTSTGTVYAWGRNDLGQCGYKDENAPSNVQSTPVEVKFKDLEEGEVVSKVGCGGEHSLAVTSKGRIFTWGSGSQFRRGTGKEEDSSVPEVIVSRFIPDTYAAIKPLAGTFHTLIVTEKQTK